MTKPAYKRVLLKLSGEALMGDDPYGINRATIERMVADVAEVAKLGVELAVVIGGGNIFRGVAASAKGMDRATGDYMGMLATVINGLAMQDALEQHGGVIDLLAVERQAGGERAFQAADQAAAGNPQAGAGSHQDGKGRDFARARNIALFTRFL